MKRSVEGERTKRVKSRFTDPQVRRVVYLFLDCLYVKRLRVLKTTPVSIVILARPLSSCSFRETYATYSPSLRPTISSVIWTSTYVLPLWTAKRRPTKLGRMVAARFWVRIGGVFGGGGRVRGRGRLFGVNQLVSIPKSGLALGSKLQGQAGVWDCAWRVFTYGTMFGPG